MLIVSNYLCKFMSCSINHFTFRPHLGPWTNVPKTVFYNKYNIKCVFQLFFKICS